MRWRTTTDLEPHGNAPPDQQEGQRASRVALATTLGIVLAAGAVWTLIALGAIPGANALPSAGGAGEPFIEATHLPPLLTVADDHLAVLSYTAACAGPTSEVSSPCDLGGTAYVREGATGAFHALPLHLVHSAAGGRYDADLPAAIAGSPTGFSYYAVIRDRTSGATVTLPVGGAAAPQRSLRLASPIGIDLGAHRFGVTSTADARVATAAWGDGTSDAGIEEGPQLEPIGASSFDADTAGTVTVLDEAHKRLLRFATGAPATPAAISVNVRGTIADLAVRRDGVSYVLESVADPGQTPLVKSFDAAGRLTNIWHTSEATAGSLRLGPDGPQVLEYPASQWMPVANDAASSATAQTALGHAGRAVVGGREIVAQREGNEARVALVDANGVARSWRIRSVTPLGEIQLAELLGDRVVVVLRTYTNTDAAFLALVLGDRGLEQHLVIAPAEWAETAPLSRFRLVGSSLFHLGSTSTGMFVDRFDLEAHS